MKEIRRAIPYVEENPLKEGKRRQQCSYVTPYNARFDEIDPDGLAL